MGRLRSILVEADTELSELFTGLTTLWVCVVLYTGRSDTTPGPWLFWNIAALIIGVLLTLGPLNPEHASLRRVGAFLGILFWVFIAAVQFDGNLLRPGGVLAGLLTITCAVIFLRHAN